MSTIQLSSNIVADRAREIFGQITGKSFHSTSSVEFEDYKFNLETLCTLLKHSAEIESDEDIQAALSELDRVEIQLQALYRNQ
jgi:hypothetical protein